MNHYRNFFAILLAVNLLAGCAAALVPATSDPARKLGWAQELFDNQDRPLPAERLINEAIEIYKTQHDELGLAEGYRVYGLFFKSQAVERQQNFYQNNGFQDKSAAYDKRLDKAAEYFYKSLALMQKNNASGSLPNVHLQIALTHWRMNNLGAACTAFDDSLKAYKARMQQHPDTKVVLPEEYSNFEIAVNDLKKRAGCRV